MEMEAHLYKLRTRVKIIPVLSWNKAKTFSLRCFTLSENSRKQMWVVEGQDGCGMIGVDMKHA